jgi:Co/Zn/Cd efflux system component
MLEDAGRDSSLTPQQLRAAVAEGSRATVFGLVASSLLAVIKLSAGILGNSYALIADGVESVLDIFSALVVWSGLRISGAEPNRSFPYGRGKAEHLAALAVATMLRQARPGSHSMCAQGSTEVSGLRPGLTMCGWAPCRYDGD